MRGDIDMPPVEVIFSTLAFSITAGSLAAARIYCTARIRESHLRGGLVVVSITGAASVSFTLVIDGWLS